MKVVKSDGILENDVDELGTKQYGERNNKLIKSVDLKGGW